MKRILRTKTWLGNIISKFNKFAMKRESSTTFEGILVVVTGAI